jgi:hypothetical protein
MNEFSTSITAIPRCSLIFSTILKVELLASLRLRPENSLPQFSRLLRHLTTTKNVDSHRSPFTTSGKEQNAFCRESGSQSYRLAKHLSRPSICWRFRAQNVSPPVASAGECWSGFNCEPLIEPRLSDSSAIKIRDFEVHEFTSLAASPGSGPEPNAFAFRSSAGRMVLGCILLEVHDVKANRQGFMPRRRAISQWSG